MDEIPGISLHIREINNFEELNDLTGEWTELYEASAISTPFQSPAWIINWWKYFGNNQLWAIAVYNRRILVGLAPMYIFNYRSNKENIKQFTFIGTGNTDYMDVLCRPGLEMESVQMLSEFLAASGEYWDICDFQEIRQSSPLLKLKVPEEFETRIIISDVCPVALLPETFDEYLAALPVALRKNTMRAKRRLMDSGTLSLETAKEENVDEYMVWLFRLHNASWKNRNMHGLLEESTLQTFHRNAARDLLKEGILRLYALKLNERIIAAVYSFIKKNRLYYYMGGFDPEFSKYSPGSVIILEILESAISEGIRKFDFLRGHEDYKYKWKAEDRNNYRMFIKKKLTD